MLSSYGYRFGAEIGFMGSEVVVVIREEGAEVQEQFGAAAKEEARSQLRLSEEFETTEEQKTNQEKSQGRTRQGTLLTADQRDKHRGELCCHHCRYTHEHGIHYSPRRWPFQNSRPYSC